MRLVVFIFYCIFFSSPTFAEDHPAETEEPKSFTLNKAAVKTFGIKFLPVSGEDMFTLPVSALVNIKEDVFLYRFRDGQYLRISVPHDHKTEGPFFKIRSTEIKAGDQVVSEGANFLRTNEIALSQGEMDHH